jgi:hypothetical protein
MGKSEGLLGFPPLCQLYISIRTLGTPGPASATVGKEAGSFPFPSPCHAGRNCRTAADTIARIPALLPQTNANPAKANPSTTGRSAASLTSSANSP